MSDYKKLKETALKKNLDLSIKIYKNDQGSYRSIGAIRDQNGKIVHEYNTFESQFEAVADNLSDYLNHL